MGSVPRKALSAHGTNAGADEGRIRIKGNALHVSSTTSSEEPLRTKAAAFFRDGECRPKARNYLMSKASFFSDLPI